VDNPLVRAWVLAAIFRSLAMT